jgi:outer membrane protein OmpA-like peptidoglycan-associated protein
MKAFLATTIIATGAMLAGGCATKKYVRNTTAPIQAKVDQVGAQTATNSKEINETRTDLKTVDEKAQAGISAAQERAATADTHAGEAMTKATQADQHAAEAGQKAEANAQGINQLRGVVANLDDYKLQTSATVPFNFNKFTLSSDAQHDLDKLADDVKADKRFFIAVEGYTDSVGTQQYNFELSKKRADAVVNYLVSAHDIPIYRIHMIGLGQEKPVDSARNRAARAKNRRVEVKVFSADQVMASMNSDANREAK